MYVENIRKNRPSSARKNMFKGKTKTLLILLTVIYTTLTLWRAEYLSSFYISPDDMPPVTPHETNPHELGQVTLVAKEQRDHVQSSTPENIHLTPFEELYHNELDSLQAETRLPDRFVKERIQGWPWYVPGGKGGTTQVRGKLFPAEDPNSDRIEGQLLYAPEARGKKKILIYNAMGDWDFRKAGSSSFSECPVKECTLSGGEVGLEQEAETADAILFKNTFPNPRIKRPPGQIWIMYTLESPQHTGNIELNDAFNWTATYRLDSDIPRPYKKWIYYNENVTSLPLTKNYAAKKTKQVAWFVSNCNSKNSRLEYAHELQKYISVDIFGSCGDKTCPRNNEKRCLKMLENDYKFYLAFENSNCKDYITEKFYVNGLVYNVIPIAMGAPREDYVRTSPKDSFIHVDDFYSPKSLAKYLHKLDKDDDLYNSYFRWKGTGRFIDDHFLCRLCALLHGSYPRKHYPDLNRWWKGPGICRDSVPVAQS